MQQKIKREFVPDELKDVYVDFYWSQDKLWNLKIEPMQLEINQLEWILEYPVWYMEPHPVPVKLMKDSTLDPNHWNRIITADLSFPIHVLKWKGRLLILDGVHRLIKAKTHGALTIMGKVLTDDHISEILPAEEEFKKGFLKQFGRN